MTMRYLMAGILAAGWVAAGACAHAEQVEFYAPVTQFAHDKGGRIHMVICYALPVADRSDIAWVFLGDPASNGMMPRQIRVVDAHGNALNVVSSEGADCILHRVSLFHEGDDYVLALASRHVAGKVAEADSSPMEIQLYRLNTNEAAGAEPTVFKPELAPVETRPACIAYDIDQAINEVMRQWRKANPASVSSGGD